MSTVNLDNLKARFEGSLCRFGEVGDELLDFGDGQLRWQRQSLEGLLAGAHRSPAAVAFVQVAVRNPRLVNGRLSPRVGQLDSGH